MGKANRTKQGAAACSLPIMTFNSSKKGQVAVIWCNADACIKAHGSAKELFRLAAGTAAGQQQQQLTTGAALAKQLDIPPRRWRRYCTLKQALRPAAAGSVCKPGDTMRQIKKALAAMLPPKTVEPHQADRTVICAHNQGHKRAARDAQVAEQPAVKKRKGHSQDANGHDAPGRHNSSSSNSSEHNTANGSSSSESSSSSSSTSSGSTCGDETSSSESSGKTSSRHVSSSSDAQTSTTSGSSPSTSDPSAAKGARKAGLASEALSQPAAKRAKLTKPLKPPTGLQTSNRSAPPVVSGSAANDTTSSSGTSSSSSISSSSHSGTTSGSTTSNTPTSSSDNNASSSSLSNSSSAQTSSTSGTTSSSLQSQPVATATGKEVADKDMLPATVCVYMRCKGGGTITAVWLNLQKVAAAPGTRPQYRQIPDQPGAAAVGALPVLTTNQLQQLAGWGMGGSLYMPRLAQPLSYREEVLPVAMPVPQVTRKFKAAMPIDSKTQELQERTLRSLEEQLAQITCRMCHADWSCYMQRTRSAVSNMSWHGHMLGRQELALKAVQLYIQCICTANAAEHNSTGHAADFVKVYMQQPGTGQIACRALWTNWQYVLKPTVSPLFILCKDGSYTPMAPDGQAVSGARLLPGFRNWRQYTCLQQDTVLGGIKFVAGTPLHWIIQAASAIRKQLDKDKKGTPMFTAPQPQMPPWVPMPGFQHTLTCRWPLPSILLESAFKPAVDLL